MKARGPSGHHQVGMGWGHGHGHGESHHKKTWLVSINKWMKHIMGLDIFGLM